MMLRWKMRKTTIVGMLGDDQRGDQHVLRHAAPDSDADADADRQLLAVRQDQQRPEEVLPDRDHAKIETTPRIGRDIGRTIDHRIRSGDGAVDLRPPPAGRCGIESKNRLSRKMLNALATAGSQIAHGVLSRFKCEDRQVDRPSGTAGPAGPSAGSSGSPASGRGRRCRSIGRSFDSAYAAAMSTAEREQPARRPRSRTVLQQQHAEVELVPRVGVVAEVRGRAGRGSAGSGRAPGRLQRAGDHPVEREDEGEREADHDDDQHGPVDHPAAPVSSWCGEITCGMRSSGLRCVGWLGGIGCRRVHGDVGSLSSRGQPQVDGGERPAARA